MRALRALLDARELDDARDGPRLLVRLLVRLRRVPGGELLVDVPAKDRHHERGRERLRVRFPAKPSTSEPTRDGPRRDPVP